MAIRALAAAALLAACASQEVERCWARVRNADPGSDELLPFWYQPAPIDQPQPMPVRIYAGNAPPPGAVVCAEPGRLRARELKAR